MYTHVQNNKLRKEDAQYVYVYMHTYMYIYTWKNQGGVRQAIGPWTVVVSLLTLIGREYVWNTMYIVHVETCIYRCDCVRTLCVGDKKFSGWNTPFCASVFDVVG